MSRKSGGTAGVTAALQAVKLSQQGLRATDGELTSAIFDADLDDCHPGPWQNRRVFPEASLKGLADTLSMNGQLQPILLTRRPEGQGGGWYIVAGERRCRAARLAGWRCLKAIEYNGDPWIATVIENEQREDVSFIDKAEGYARLKRESGLSNAEIARATGKSQGEIGQWLKILTLPAAILDQLRQGEYPMVSPSLAIEIAYASPEAQLKLWELAKDGSLTIKAARANRAAAEAGGTNERTPIAEPTAPLPLHEIRKLSLKGIGQIINRFDKVDIPRAALEGKEGEEVRARLLELREKIDQTLAD